MRGLPQVRPRTETADMLRLTTLVSSSQNSRRPGVLTSSRLRSRLQHNPLTRMTLHTDTVIRGVMSLEELAPFSPHLRGRLKRLWTRDSHGLWSGASLVLAVSG